MKTNLTGKSNAILTESGFGVIAIIACSGGEGKLIDKKLLQAIKEHFSVPKGTEIKLTQVNGMMLSNQKPISFYAEWEEDGENHIIDFDMEILTTY